jgi:hypothetical protein
MRVSAQRMTTSSGVWCDTGWTKASFATGVLDHSPESVVEMKILVAVGSS